MKLKLLLYTVLALFIIITLGGFLALRNLNIEQAIDETRTVYIKNSDEGYQLIRNGKPFFIKGAGGDSHFKELAEIGGNTIRVFDTSNLQEKLDEAHRHNLAVIVDIYIPSYSKAYNLYEDEKENEILKQEIRDLVHQHKDHPALLIWNLGNEINYPLVFRKNDFIRTFNEIVSMIQEIDPNHPVSTSIIGVGRKTMSSIYIHSPDLDLISFNTFGNTRFINSHLAQISLLFGSRPYFFSEYGPNGPWESSSTSWGAPIEETSTVKSERISARFNRINNIDDGANLGSLMFYWGNKLERTHTWFSLFKDEYKSESVKVLENLWNQSDSSTNESEVDYILANTQDLQANNSISQDASNQSGISPELIGLDYMLVSDKQVHENVIFAPGELSHAEVFFHENSDESLRIDWEIYPEAWYSDTSEIVLNSYTPIDSFVNFEKNRATFHAPVTEGPYRIFAYIYNQDGFFATTNTPFYVITNK